MRRVMDAHVGCRGGASAMRPWSGCSAGPRSPRRSLATSISSLAAIAVIVVGSYFVLRSVTIREAERDTRERVILEGRLVQTGLSDGVLTGDRAALATLDELVQGQILGESVVRVKLWTRDGRILYSDEPRLIGQTVRAGGGGARAVRDRRRRRRAERPRRAREPLRARGGQAAGGAHGDPHAGGHAGAVRDLPALRRRQRQRLADPAHARPAAARRPAGAARGPGPARLRPRPPPAARPRRARAAAGARDRGVRQRAPPDRRRPARRDRAGPRGRRVRPRAARGQGPAGRAAGAQRQRRPACARACATCARCWSRSTRRGWSRPGWRPRSTTC